MVFFRQEEGNPLLFSCQPVALHSTHIGWGCLEIAGKAGYDDSVSDIETRIRTAIAALEEAGYLERGNNVPHVYATGITVKNVDEARRRITESLLFENDEVEKAVRVIKSLITQKHIAKAQDSEDERSGFIWHIERCSVT